MDGPCHGRRSVSKQRCRRATPATPADRRGRSRWTDGTDRRSRHGHRTPTADGAGHRDLPLTCATWKSPCAPELLRRSPPEASGPRHHSTRRRARTPRDDGRALRRHGGHRAADCHPPVLPSPASRSSRSSSKNRTTASAVSRRRPSRAIETSSGVGASPSPSRLCTSSHFQCSLTPDISSVYDSPPAQGTAAPARRSIQTCATQRLLGERPPTPAGDDGGCRRDQVLPRGC